MLEGANILQAQEAQEYTVMMSKMTTTELDQYLLSLPSVPAELTEKDALRVGLEVVSADIMMNASGKEIGLAFFCPKCKQMHVHSMGTGMRKAHCVSPKTYKFGHYFVKNTGVRKVFII